MTMYILGTGISCSKTVGKKKKKFSYVYRDSSRLVFRYSLLFFRQRKRRKGLGDFAIKQTMLPVIDILAITYPANPIWAWAFDSIASKNNFFS